MDNNEEREHRIIGGESEQSLPNEQVRGGRDRDEFGQSLNDAEQEGVEEGHSRWLMEDG